MNSVIPGRSADCGTVCYQTPTPMNSSISCGVSVTPLPGAWDRSSISGKPYGAPDLTARGFLQG